MTDPQLITENIRKIKQNKTNISRARKSSDCEYIFWRLCHIWLGSDENNFDTNCKTEKEHLIYI